MVINWACQGHNLHYLYINTLLCPQLRRSWSGKLVWNCSSLHLSTPPRSLPSPPPLLKKIKTNFFLDLDSLWKKSVGWQVEGQGHTWRENDDKMVINWACQGHNFHNLYTNALLCPQLWRSWRGKLVWACSSVHPAIPHTLNSAPTPLPPTPPPPKKKTKKNFFLF